MACRLFPPAILLLEFQPQPKEPREPKQRNEPKQEIKDLGKHNPAFSPNPAENDTKVETFELR